MRSEELARLGLGQFPIVIGAVVVAVNVDGVGARRDQIHRALLAESFSGRSPAGRIRHQGAQPGADAARRRDRRGAPLGWLRHDVQLHRLLSKVSPEWKLKVGSGLLVPWPTGSGANGNEGVAQAVSRVRNSIGYVEYAQAMQLKLSYALVQNRAGQFVRPDTGGVQAAAATADWARTSDFYLLLTDGPGEKRLPHHRDGLRPRAEGGVAQQDRAALDFFRWSLENGSRTAAELGYVPLPAPLVQQVLGYWSRTFGIGA